MFNLIVTGNGDAWEAPPFASPYVRFGEYSHQSVMAALDLDQPDSLLALTQCPVLLMYEVGAIGPNVGVVRHGRVGNIARRGRDLIFDFVPDPTQGYLPRQAVIERSAELGIEPFERYRTHWAVKEGNLPSELIAVATREIVPQTMESLATAFARALDETNGTDAHALMDELKQFPASVEKAQAMLPSRVARKAVPELLALTGVSARSPEARRAVEAVLERDARDEDLPDDWPFTMVWFLEKYGSPTEHRVAAEYVRQCGVRLHGLGSELQGHSVEELALALWRCARSQRLVGDLRREIAVLIDLLERLRHPDGYWSEPVDASHSPSVRATAIATVVLQRLGNDRFHDLTKHSVHWLLEQILPDTGALPQCAGQPAADLLATTFSMEAVRRSDIADELPHVLAKGDAWILSKQTDRGQWTSPPLPGDLVTTIVLGYLARRSDVLPQVDGFLLMARDFFRRGEQLGLEGGANNRRLSAIAIVHAVEMFLYGVFEQRDDLGLSAYADQGVQTLGPRGALRELEGALQRIGRLSRDQRLPHRDQLSSLIGRRDGIIHRAHEISQAELHKGIAHARQFIENTGEELLELNLLE